jgi:hypothetical protein
MELNKNEVGYGVTAGRAGIKIDRGDADPQLLVFDETDKNFKIGTDTSLKSLATQEYVDNKNSLNADISAIPTKVSQLTNDSGYLTSIPSNYAKINDSGVIGDTTETYSIDKIISLLSNKQNKIYLQVTQPNNPVLNDIWINSTSSPYVMNVYNGTSFIQVGGSASGGVSISDWLTSTSYTISASFVIYNNSLYRCIATHISGTSFDSSKWQYIGSNDAKSINGIIVDDSNRSNGRGLFYNQSTNKLEYANVNIAGIVGGSQITNVGFNTTIASGSEITFNHPISTNIIPVIEEQIVGSSVTDTHIDFSDSSKYISQDSGKLLFINNKVQLDVYTKLLMHMNDSTFKDECGHTIINNGVTLDINTKKNGTGSAKFNGSNYFNINNNADLDLGSSNFTIEFWVYPTVNLNSAGIIGKLNVSGFGAFVICMSNGNWIFNSSNSTSAWTISGKLIGSVDLNMWQHLAVCRDNNNLYLFKNGILITTTTITHTLISNSDTINIGRYNYSSPIYFTGYIDEVRIIKGIAKWTANFVVPTIEYLSPYVITNIPIYLQTMNLSDYNLTAIDTITSLTIPTTIPTNTSVKCLFSVDNYANYLYYDGNSIKKFTGDLTIDWSTTSNSVSQIQSLFTNLSITSLNSMLSSLGITAVNLDLVFQLNTTDVTATPSISSITMNYITKGHTEFATIGRYDESVSFGVKRISSSQLGVKNLTNKSRSINVNIVTSGS